MKEIVRHRTQNPMPDDPEQLLNRLKDEYRELDMFTDEAKRYLKATLRHIVNSYQIPLVEPIQARVKKWPSIAEKLRRGVVRVNSVAELDDLVGGRLVLLYPQDAAKTVEIVTKEFPVIKSKRITSDEADRFSYSAAHIVVRLEYQSEFPQEKPALRAEIQIRTLAQELWAAASHDLTYKRDQTSPMPLRRSLHRLSALLELVDAELERLRKDLDASQKPLDAYLDDDELDFYLIAHALAEAFLQEKHRRGDEDYLGLLFELNSLGIDTKRKLLQFLHARSQDALNIAGHVEATRMLLKKEFGNRYHRINSEWLFGDEPGEEGNV